MLKSPHEVEAALRWLEGLGYRAAFRDGAWVECLLWCEDERWLGRGPDRDEAALDALRQALPSRAARALLDAALAAEAAPQVGPFADAAPADVAPMYLVQEQDAAEVDLGGAVAADRRELVPDDDSLVHPGEAAPVAAVAPPPETPRAAPAERRRLVEPMTVDAALGAVGLLHDAITAERPEVALMAPHRQGLILLAWICRARSAEEATDDEPVVVKRVAEIARMLSSWAKAWWPGAVIGLRKDTTPNDVGREIGLPVDERPRTWLAAALAVEAHLASVEERDERAGLDEYGWADASFLEPGPLRPDQQLHELRRRVEPVLGSLDAAPPGSVPKALTAPKPDHVASWVEWARLVRWLRGFVSDFEEWGALVGRLRWLAAQVKAAAPLAKLLDPALRPPRPWAAELGQDPDAKRLKLLKRRVLQTAPDPRQPQEAASVARWLADAIEVLPGERIASCLAPHGDLLVALSAMEPPDGTNARRWKRRLTKILAAATALDGRAMPPSLEQEEIPDAVEDVQREDPADALLQVLLPRTRGKSALFIGNRRDPDLHDELKRTFSFSDLDWCEGGPRRLQDVSDRVDSGRYDFVLGATGFQSHSMDAQMVQACRRAGVPYVRVHRGRRLACILALSRELGLAAGAQRVA